MVLVESEKRIKPTLLIHSLQRFKLVRRWNTWRFRRAFDAAKEGDVVEIPVGSWCLEAALALNGYRVFSHQILETGEID